MDNQNNILSQIAVTMLPTLNSVLFLPLIKRCGDIEGFFTENDKALNKLYSEFNVKADFFARTKAMERAKIELEHTAQYDIQICAYDSYLYPPLLSECADSPLVFYYKGTLTADASTYLAIVGTRRSSEACRSRVNTLVKELSETRNNFTIVSGLAFGIDCAAHVAALEHKIRTVAVLGNGLHIIYPAAHKNMAQTIIEKKGAIISEFPTTTPIHPSNFLRRNRIIAGMSHATLVAESAEKGGAMSTARIANSHSRDVFAFPGRPEDKMSAGCNSLIKTNSAALVENGDDIIKLLNLTPKIEKPEQMTLDFWTEDNEDSNNSTDNETAVLQILADQGSNKGSSIDELSRLSSIPINELTPLMLKLELEGKVQSLPGNCFSQI
ncbi:DNA processing protein DprA [Bacteroidia bacterium]|nr:DNA processing protein DprA [Bacteroidia bacterium]